LLIGLVHFHLTNEVEVFDAEEEKSICPLESQSKNKLVLKSADYFYLL
jgi:hypothetical protein